MTVSNDDVRAPYVQVADALRAEILSGKLKPGQKLPSARDLADRFQVAVMTASSGVRVLREEGLVYSAQGRGTFVRQEAAGADGARSQVKTDLANRVGDLERQVRDLSERLLSVEAAVGESPGAPR